MSAAPVDQLGADLDVVVAMLTYRRPGDLSEALPRILAHTEAVGARLMVVDNDPEGSAEAAVAAFGGRVWYVNETRPGIAAARNRALDEAPADALLVFIDDDERPTDDWLELLLATYRRHRPAAVVGPVVSEYDVEPDAWVAAGRFFDRRRLPTGTAVEVAATNNLLLDLAQVHRHALRFDEAFGASGGSDTLFTRRLVRAGGRMIWCDQAVVIDKVPASRTTRDWVLRRAFRSGNSWTRTSLELAAPGLRRTAVRGQSLGIGLVRIVAGSAAVVVGAVTGRLGRRVRGTRTVARGAGMAAGSFGYVYQEYRRTP
ncbi:glycosyltransferase family 2 protein [Nakamurella deserti]|uniref:glycosyltransferase family 2 protein n=1 Tax=Nakamurella deserti TaxID=2164074 RepID=UPI000DBE12D7|nr:glycosyltransferase [Nakamurella deserti]